MIVTAVPATQTHAKCCSRGAVVNCRKSPDGALMAPVGFAATGDCTATATLGVGLPGWQCRRDPSRSAAASCRLAGRADPHLLCHWHLPGSDGSDVAYCRSTGHAGICACEAGYCVVQLVFLIGGKTVEAATSELSFAVPQFQQRRSSAGGGDSCTSCQCLASVADWLNIVSQWRNASSWRRMPSMAPFLRSTMAVAPLINCCNYPTAVVLFSKGAMLGTACISISALVATFAGRNNFVPLVVLIVPSLVLLNMCFDYQVFRELALIMLPTSLFEITQEMGVASGAGHQSRVRTLVCPANASSQIHYSQASTWPCGPLDCMSEALSIGNSLPPFHVQVHCCRQTCTPRR